MARKRGGKPWEAAFRRIRAVWWPDRVYPPKPTPTDLDAAEAELGFRLPASYRAFAEEFGLGGELHSMVTVFPLGCSCSGRSDDEDGWPGSVRDWAGIDAASLLLNEPDSHPGTDRVRRLIVFAADTGGGNCTFGFDPHEPAEHGQGEYRIYVVTRYGEVETITDSFAGFLVWVDEHYRYQNDAEEQEWWDDFAALEHPPAYKPDSAIGVPMGYESHGIRRKEAPDEAGVRAWLAWNHGAVASLVAAIRDGQRDAFGPLADALEEAGCANADLLASCRTGDPDIDGVWVLRDLGAKG
ncbi:MAG: SMI1/KNR4 family protein [Gemmataceae bacterium]|nr:SMI1/KNR4 family protein [Gemmataceae bacterium]